MQRIPIEGFEKEQLVVAETPKMKSEQSKTLSYSTNTTSTSVDGEFVEGVEISDSESSGVFSGQCIHIRIRFGRAVKQDTMKAPSRPAPDPPKTTPPQQRCSSGVTEGPRCAEAAAITAVQQLVAEEERVRQSLRYEQQVICAKRYANFGHLFQKLYCRLFQPSLNSEQTSTPPNELNEPWERSSKELADSSKATPKKITAKSNAPLNKNKASEYSGVLAKLETSLENSLKRSLSDLRQVVEPLGNCSPSVSVRMNKWRKFVEKKEPRPVSSVTKRRQNEIQVTERRTDELQVSLDDFDAWTVTSGILVEFSSEGAPQTSRRTS